MPVLVDVISSEEEIVRFEEEYHLDFEVPCSIAHCRTPHKHGYLALLRDGNHARVGNVCGTHLLGGVCHGNEGWARRGEAELVLTLLRQHLAIAPPPRLERSAGSIGR